MNRIVLVSGCDEGVGYLYRNDADDDYTKEARVLAMPFEAELPPGASLRVTSGLGYWLCTEGRVDVYRAVPRHVQRLTGGSFLPAVEGDYATEAE